VVGRKKCQTFVSYATRARIPDIQEYYELILIESHKQVPANQALDSETHWQRKGSLSSAPTALYSQQNNNVSDKVRRFSQLYFGVSIKMQHLA